MIPGAFTMGGGLLGTGQKLTQAQQFGVNNSMRLLILRAMGAIEPSFISTGTVETTASISTAADLKTILNVIGNDYGASLAAAPTLLYLRRAQDLGGRVAPGDEVHKQFAFNAAMIDWQRVSGRVGQEARIEYRLRGTYTAPNLPLVVTGDVAVPVEENPQDVWYPGPVTIDGAPFDGWDDISIVSRAQIRLLTDGPEPWPSFAFVGTASPQIVLRSFDADLWEQYRPEGASVSTVRAVFRKKLAGSGFEPGASNVHISFTLAVAHGGLSDGTATAGQEFRSGIAFSGTKGTSTPALTINTTDTTTDLATSA